MFWFSLVLFILGLVWGSFLNVVIFRVANGLSPLSGRSKCPKCKKTIPWKYNIPLISFFWLKGKCAYCGKKITWQYPVVESLTGILFVWWYWIGTGFFNLAGRPWTILQPLFWLLMGMILLVIFFSDLLYEVIPDVINLLLFSLVVVYRLGLVYTGEMRLNDLLISMMCGLGIMLFFVFLWLITKKKGFGEGDIKMAPSIGLLLGWPRSLVALFLSYMLGAVVAVTLLVFRRRKFGQTIPFGPFLVLGMIMSMLFGDWLWVWYLGMLK